MKRKGRKIIRLMFLLTLGLAFLFPALNFFLVKRLESYLKKELTERASLATDGFYRLSFDKLSIRFWDGRLKMEGVSFVPDPVVFNHWAAMDSLPPAYVETQVDLIDFKGVNLTWHWDFRQLHFDTFEIQSPQIRFFSVLPTNRMKEQTRHINTKTLYEVMSPYINVLSVKRLNLKNASISYHVEGGVSPIAYTLDNVSFHGYGFQLDSMSYRRGKLLYCENFDFVSNQSQVLLTSNDFVLKTDSIRLSTEDSVFFIKDMTLIPQEGLWRRRDQEPSRYLMGHIGVIDVRGISFYRRDALNYLTARSFDIHTSNIHMYDQEKKDKEPGVAPGYFRQGLADAGSLVRALSLYDVISPVLHSVSVGQINIERAGLMYSKGSGKNTEVYAIRECNLHAKGFLIDSAIGLGPELHYFQSVALDAKEIQGVLPNRNIRFQIKRLDLGTTGEIFLRNVSASFASLTRNDSMINLRVEDGRFSIQDSLLRLKQVELFSEGKQLRIVSPQIDLRGICWPPDNLLEQAVAVSLDVEEPTIDWFGPDSTHLFFSMNHLGMKGLSLDSLSQVRCKRLLITEGQLAYSWKADSRFTRVGSLRDIRLMIDDPFVDLKNNRFQVADFQLLTHDLQIPLDSGFYLLKIGRLALGRFDLRLADIHLASSYPKMEFAYKQPRHQDWFDVKVGDLRLANVDWQGYWQDRVLRVGGLWINSVLLQNMKNRKIPVEPHLVPMMYEGIQKAPVRFLVDTAVVTDCSVVYEELPVKGEELGRLFLSGMNGRFSGLTNIVSYPDQFITLSADGYLMDKGYFTAIWKLPVDSLYDRFLLEGQLDGLDLTALNAIVEPLSPAKIRNGYTHDVSFSMDASSKEGRIRLAFPYRDLRIEVRSAFLSRLANLMLRHDNPSHPGKEGEGVRKVDMLVIRDPYHSTFNYLWQLLRPALIESVGISQKEQEVAIKVAGLFENIKHFFHKEERRMEDLDLIRNDD